MVAVSTSLANDMSLPKAVKLAQLFVNIFNGVWQREGDQAFVTNVLVYMITAVSESCSPESLLTISRQQSIRQNIQHGSGELVMPNV